MRRHRIRPPAGQPVARAETAQARLGDRDEWIIRTVRRAAPNKLLRADANAAWDVDHAIRMSRLLADNGFDLLEQPDGTLLRMTHTGLPTAEQCANHADGWAHYLGRLAVVGAGRDPGPDSRHGHTGRA